MSKSEVQRFHQDTLQDLALQQQLKQAESNETLIALVMEIGKEKEYSFTEQEVAEYINEMNTGVEISDEQLEAIAGGVDEQSEQFYDSNDGCTYN